MLTTITGSNIWVTDQDEALDFYVGTLGMEVTADIDLGFMRWLTVALPGQPTPNLVLCPITVSPLSEAERELALALLAKGVLGSTFVATDDCQATFDRLIAQGVVATQPPTQQAYGIDCQVSDPFGNQVRIAQITPLDAALAASAS